MGETEAQARIKINKLLEEAGWRLFDDERGRTNILLENKAEIREGISDDEKSRRGFLDYLLLDDEGFPLVVVEAKAEGIHPLAGKEQSRIYTVSKNCRFVILSNGNLHYFWDLERGNPNVVSKFPMTASAALPPSLKTVTIRLTATATFSLTPKAALTKRSGM